MEEPLPMTEPPTDVPEDAETVGSSAGDPPQPAPPSAASARRLTRSADSRVGGVAAGFAEYFEVDPTLARLAAVVLLIVSFGSVLLAYLVLWVVLPSADGDVPLDRIVSAGARDSVQNASDWVSVDRNKWVIGGILAVLLFSGVILDDWVFGSVSIGGAFLPVLLIGVGVLLMTRRGAPSVGEHDGTQTQRNATGAGAAPPPQTQSSYGSGSGGPIVPYVRAAGTPPGPPHTASIAKTPSIITPVVLSAMLGSAGVILLLDQTGAIDATLGLGGAVWLFLIGAGLLVSAFRGRAPGLILIGVLVALGTLGARIVDPIIVDGSGERRIAVVDVAELQDEYRLGAGSLKLDLSELDLEGQTRTVDVDLAVGELRVDLPDEANLVVHLDNTIGDLDWRDFASVPEGSGRFQNESGFRNEIDVRIVGDADGGTLIINIHGGIGQVVVSRVR